MTVKINGTAVNISKVDGYIDVGRVWSAGDRGELTIPSELQVSRCTDNQNVVAFTYGPVVLCAGLGSESMTTSSVGWGVTTATKTVTVKEIININSPTGLSIDNWLSNIRTNLVQTPGKLEFTLKNTDADSSSLVFTPYYQKYKDRYGIYFTLNGPRSPFTKIEAESYNSQTGISTESCSEGGLNVANIENGDYVVYNDMNFDSGAASFQARLSSATNGGNIEIRLDSANGTLVGTCPVASTGGWQTWTDAKCSIKGASGRHNLYLKLQEEAGTCSM